MSWLVGASGWPKPLNPTAGFWESKQSEKRTFARVNFWKVGREENNTTMSFIISRYVFYVSITIPKAGASKATDIGGKLSLISDADVPW